MKRLSLFILLLGLYSCELDGNSSSSTSDIGAEQLRNDLNITSGLRIVQYIDDGEDETDDFDDFLFRFSTDGTVTATRGNEVVEGSYRVFRDDGQTELELDFPPTSILDDLDDDWYFRGKANNRLTFEDDDDDNDFERLVFEF
ncbi:hypothetical protein [Algoriphagus formosus]|uniref:Lipocalin-like domain-containing protein n=1 Tax=Algoriphagus formosus TaxID=2007308 RepID=A0A4R5UWG4_9BACT|nr:hypothetical protein [Algoriphagus aquimaris]TDK43445.1 hypothetical protein E1898_12615 [Algoriphagus aquimaris]